MLEALTISLITLGIHCLFWQGMIFSAFTRPVGFIVWIIFLPFVFLLMFGFNINFILEESHNLERKLIKPIYDCLICMSSFWTFIIGKFWYHMEFKEIIFTMLIVCGINVILDSVIGKLRGTA